MRGKTVYESYKRSAGQTVKLSINEVKHLISISTGTDFEVQTAMHNIDDDEVLRQLDYDSYFSLQEKRFPDTKNSLLHTLSTEDLIKNYNKNWKYFPNDYPGNDGAVRTGPPEMRSV